MQSPGDNDMGKSREQRTREARAAKAEAARLAAEAEAAKDTMTGSDSALETSADSIVSADVSADSTTATSGDTIDSTPSTVGETQDPVGSEFDSQTPSGTQTPPSPSPQAGPAPGSMLRSLIASSPPDAGLTPPASLVSPTEAQNIPSHIPQNSQPVSAQEGPPVRQRIIGASQPGISSQSSSMGAPTPRMIGLPNPTGAEVPAGSPVQYPGTPNPQPQAPTPPPPAPVKREPRPEPGMTLDGKVCRHEYVRIYQRKLKGLDRRLVATRAFLPVGFKMGDFTYLSPGSFCFCSKCRKRLFPKRTEAEKQQARVERKLLKESGAIDLMAVGKPREKGEFDDELEFDIDDLDDSDDESIFGKGPILAGPDTEDEADENLDDDKLKLDIHVDELEVESVDVEDIKAEGVKLAAEEDDFDEACSLDVDEES